MNTNTFEINAVYVRDTESSMRSSYVVGSQSYRFEFETTTQSASMYSNGSFTPHGVAVEPNDVNVGIRATSSSSFNVSNVNGDNFLDINGDGNLRLRNGQIVGTVSLVAGSANVSNSYVSTTSIIFVTKQNSTSTYSISSVNQSPGSFTIQSSDPTDSDVVGWMLINPFT